MPLTKEWQQNVSWTYRPIRLISLKVFQALTSLQNVFDWVFLSCLTWIAYSKSCHSVSLKAGLCILLELFATVVCHCCLIPSLLSFSLRMDTLTFLCRIYWLSLKVIVLCLSISRPAPEASQQHQTLILSLSCLLSELNNAFLPDINVSSLLLKLQPFFLSTEQPICLFDSNICLLDSNSKFQVANLWCSFQKMDFFMVSYHSSQLLFTMIIVNSRTPSFSHGDSWSDDFYILASAKQCRSTH